MEYGVCPRLSNAPYRLISHTCLEEGGEVGSGGFLSIRSASRVYQLQLFQNDCSMTQKLKIWSKSQGLTRPPAFPSSEEVYSQRRS